MKFTVALLGLILASRLCAGVTLVPVPADPTMTPFPMHTATLPAAPATATQTQPAALYQVRGQYNCRDAAGYNDAGIPTGEIVAIVNEGAWVEKTGLSVEGWEGVRLTDGTNRTCWMSVNAFK